MSTNIPVKCGWHEALGSTFDS